jgi:hypothetical protein
MTARTRQRLTLWAVVVLLAIRAAWLLHETTTGVWP